MSDCDTLRAEADGLVALPGSHPDRVAATAHAASCEPCARALRAAERTRELLGHVPDLPVPSPDAFATMAQAVLVQDATAPRRAHLGLIAGLAAATGGAAVFAWTQHGEPFDLAGGVAILALLLAGGLAVLATRRPGLAGALALAASAALALAAGSWPGDMEAAAGLNCAAAELAAATLPMIALLWAARAAPPSMLGAATAAGALAGQAALLGACPDSPALPHLLAFHFGAVVLSLAAGMLLAATARRRGQSASAAS